MVGIHLAFMPLYVLGGYAIGLGLSVPRQGTAIATRAAQCDPAGPGTPFAGIGS